jgi:hypothetical protein
MRGRAPAAQVVVVHRRQVVVDQGVGVNQLDRRGGRQHGAWLGARGACAGKTQDRADALAPGEQGVTHRLGQARGLVRVAEAQALQVFVDELPELVGIVAH